MPLAKDFKHDAGQSWSVPRTAIGGIQSSGACQGNHPTVAPDPEERPSLIVAEGVLDWPLSANPTYQEESYLSSAGTRRRSSSEKFSRNVTWTSPFSSASAFSSGKIAKCFPSGARS